MAQPPRPAAMPVRRITFDYPPDTPMIWTPTRPEFSCAANSVSLLMPTIEPYFVRSVRAVVDRLDEPLRSTTAAYIGQESQHHRQHVRFNRMLTERYPSLSRLERLIAVPYRWLERTRSAAFNLAFAAASETMAYSAARWAANHRRELFTGADEVTATLFLWHLAEEVEHKSAAFDVYWTLNRGRRFARLRYAGAMVTALALVVAFVFVGTTMMVAAERRLANPIAWLRLTRWCVTFAFELLTNLAVSLFPSHHPSDLVDPRWYEVWLEEFDAESGSMPVWHAGHAEVADG